MNRTKILSVVGPTGSGKTNLAVQLAKKFNGVLISADSRQVYKGLDIGTNKEGEPGQYHDQPARIVDGIAQLLIDVAEPAERFTLHNWLDEAKAAIELVTKERQLPILVGGTGLYVTALLEGYQLGGGRFAKNKKPTGYESLILMPEVDRTILNEKSDQRFERIFDDLVAETKKLIKNGVSKEWLERIGLDYRYAVYFINGQSDREKAIADFQRASRAYIRRQQTWWRHHGEVIEVRDAKEAIIKTEYFLREDIN